jgi:hypothetical protein
VEFRLASVWRALETYFTSECLLYDVVSNSYRFLDPMKMPLAAVSLREEQAIMIRGEDARRTKRGSIVQVSELV